LRWLFQLLEGIHRVRVTVQDQVHTLIEGLNEVRLNMLRLFGEKVCQVYPMASGEHWSKVTTAISIPKRGQGNLLNVS